MLSELLRPGLALIYGGGGSGKTLLAVSLTMKAARAGGQCLYAYSGKLHPLLLRKLAALEGQVAVVKIEGLQGQGALVRGLHRLNGAGYDLVVFDAFTEAYRLFVAEAADPIKASKALNQQLAMLSELAEGGLKVVLTSRARRLAEDLEPEASSLFEYWSNIIARLERLSRPGWRRLTFEKGPSGIEGSVLEFELGGLE